MNPKALLAAVLVIALAGGIAFFTFFGRDDVEEASVSNAIDGAGSSGADDPDADGGGTDSEGGGDGAAEDGPAVAQLTDASGSWTVTTEIGEFDFADASSTFAGFRVNEELRTVGQTEAIGRTPAVSGQMTIEGTTLTDAELEVDFTALVSDVPRRDTAMKRAIGVDANPTATFTVTEPIDFGAIPSGGETVTFTATGDLTVNGITNPASFDMEASVSDGNIVVAGSTPVAFADFDIEAPQLGPVVSIAQEGTIEVQVWFVPA